MAIADPSWQSRKKQSVSFSGCLSVIPIRSGVSLSASASGNEQNGANVALAAALPPNTASSGRPTALAATEYLSKGSFLRA